MNWKSLCTVIALLLAVSGGTARAAEQHGGPANGYLIHVLAPHQMEDGMVAGPYHHYCKPVLAGKVFQCLLFESADSDAVLVGVEYFVEKGLARSYVPLIQWNRHYHDHELEIASGRVKVLDVGPEEAKAIADKASGTDGIIFQLWQKGAPVPDGKVTFPTSISHIFRSK
jgi:uncharacterized protein DUF1264